MNDKINLTVFFDSVGRTIIGEKIDSKSNEQNLLIKNPAVVHIVPNQQTGQIQLQILPLFFKEFLADKTDPTFWNYKRDHIVESQDLAIDFKLEAQYRQIFSTVPAEAAPQQPQTQGSSEVIKLFDE